MSLAVPVRSPKGLVPEFGPSHPGQRGLVTQQHQAQHGALAQHGREAVQAQRIAAAQIHLLQEGVSAALGEAGGEPGRGQAQGALVAQTELAQPAALVQARLQHRVRVLLHAAAPGVGVSHARRQVQHLGGEGRRGGGDGETL